MPVTMIALDLRALKSQLSLWPLPLALRALFAPPLCLDGDEATAHGTPLVGLAELIAGVADGETFFLHLLIDLWKATEQVRGDGGKEARYLGARGGEGRLRARFAGRMAWPVRTRHVGVRALRTDDGRGHPADVLDEPGGAKEAVTDGLPSQAANGERDHPGNTSMMSGHPSHTGVDVAMLKMLVPMQLKAAPGQVHDAITSTTVGEMVPHAFRVHSPEAYSRLYIAGFVAPQASPIQLSLQ